MLVKCSDLAELSSNKIIYNNTASLSIVWGLKQTSVNMLLLLLISMVNV